MGNLHHLLDHGGRSRGLSGRGRSLAALDGLNFFLADVQSGLGPFLGIYLLTTPGWNAASIGLVMTIGGVAGLVVQTPAGALIDRTRHKRALVIGAAVGVSVGAFMTWPAAWPQRTAGRTPRRALRCCCGPGRCSSSRSRSCCFT